MGSQSREMGTLMSQILEKWEQELGANAHLVSNDSILNVFVCNSLSFSHTCFLFTFSNTILSDHTRAKQKKWQDFGFVAKLHVK